MKREQILRARPWWMAIAMAGLIAWAAPPSQALEIVPHFTAGPCTQDPTACGGFSSAWDGPKPVLPGSDTGSGSDTGTDCSAISEADRRATQTGSICAALDDLERFIRDEVTLHFEMYRLTQSPFLGSAAVNLVFFLPKPGTGMNPERGYQVVLHLLRKKNALDGHTISAVNHIPNAENLDYIPSSWPPLLGLPTPEGPPTVVLVPRAQLKALGIKGNVPASFPVDAPFGGGFTLPGMDGRINFTDPPFKVSFGGAFPEWDLDPDDGVGISGPDNSNFGPDDWNGWTLDPGAATPAGQLGTFPSNFVSDGALDLRSVTQHEVLHQMGFIGSWDDLNLLVGLAFPFVTVSADELLRFRETAALEMAAVKDIRKTPRNWSTDQVKDPMQLLDRTNVDNCDKVFVYAVGSQGAEYFPLTCGSPLGLRIPGLGSGWGGSHARSNMDWREDAQGRFVGYTILRGFPDGFRLMGPELLPNFVEKISRDDLTLLDAVGWDVDHSGQATPGSGGEADMTLEELEDRWGVEAEGSVITIEGH